MSTPDVPNSRPPNASPEPARRSLGPVPDLEAHVPPEWWRFIFNATYLKTDGDVVDDLQITAREVDAFAGILGLTPGNHVLDLCCGQGRHVLELARRGFGNATGMDRSHFLIQRARSQARKESLGVRFREGDARKTRFSADTFDDVLILGNSFGYFETRNEDLGVLREVARVLKPGGRVLLDVTDGAYLAEHFQPRSWEWIDDSNFVCRERSLSRDGSRLISREVVTHIEEGVLVDQFYAERLYTRDGITALLDQAGFSDIEVHRDHTAESTRNQDLGMMERRILVTACIRKEWSPARKRPGETRRRVTVVMGDPRQRDDVKPAGVFDEDDLVTIDRLKDALRKLEGYEFSYLDDHGRMIADLVAGREKIDLVLNLCDEGFRNEPRQELHVAALLEAIGIPYTGAGPQCMAFCYDKSLVRGIAREMGIPVPEALFIKPEDMTFDVDVSFPVIVKPNLGDSSFGITQKSVAETPEDLLNAIAAIRDRCGFDKPMLVEELLTGADLTVGILGNPPESYRVLPVLEEDYSALPPGLPKICGYEAKWLPDSPYWKSLRSIPADLPEATTKALVEWSAKLFDRLACRDYARFDWRLDSTGLPRLLEVNPNPGWCWDGHLARMASLDDMDYSEMLRAILNVAEQRLGLTETPGARERPINVRDGVVG